MKTEVTLFALSSDGETQYAVEFKYLNETLTVACDCQAGSFQKSCKHVALFLAGDAKLLCKRSEVEDLKLVASWAQAVGVDGQFAEITRTEAEIDRAKKTLAKLKETLCSGLYKGLSK